MKDDPYIPVPISPMVESKAIGGPRHNIKLSAPRNWDGIVMQSPNRVYNGYYKWTNEQAWVWQDQSAGTGQLSRGTGTAHHKRRKNALAY